MHMDWYYRLRVDTCELTVNTGGLRKDACGLRARRKKPQNKEPEARVTVRTEAPRKTQDIMGTGSTELASPRMLSAQLGSGLDMEKETELISPKSHN